MCYSLRKKVAKTLEQVFTDGYITGQGYSHKVGKTLQDHEDELIEVILQELFERGDKDE